MLKMNLLKPPRLQKGDCIGIIAPSGDLAARYPHRIKRAQLYLEKIGFSVKLFPTVFLKSKGGKAGSVTERVTDIHNAFKDRSIKAIVCAIGGLAANELLPHLNYNLIRKNRKIFCGYSDITVLHNAIQKKSKIVTFYGPCAMTQFGEYPEPLKYTIDFFLKAAAGRQPVGRIIPSKEWTDEVLDWSTKEDLKRLRHLFPNNGLIWLKKGQVRGRIVGGCLNSLLQLKGTEYDIDYDNKIMFVETPEGEDFAKGMPLSYINSQLMDLRNAKIFDKIKGLIVGLPFGYNEDERNKFRCLIEEHTRDYDFPVLFNVNIGHADPMITIPLGIKVSLDYNINLFSIDELGTEL